MIARIADKLILRPTRHPIRVRGKSRLTLPHRGGELEIWKHRVGGGNSPDVFVLKFPGTAGRAERSTEHPADAWSDWTVDLWTLNLPGYGGSSGPASISQIMPAAEAAIDAIRQAAAGRPVVVAGNSLGTVAAVYVAARFPVDGLILRNPTPLRQVIMSRFGWWNLWLGSSLIAAQIPRDLCIIENAARTEVPAVILSSGRDRIVPPPHQRRMIEAYAGEKRVFVMPDADHACPLKDDEQPAYFEMLQWLRGRVAGNTAQPFRATGENLAYQTP